MEAASSLEVFKRCVEMWHLGTWFSEDDLFQLDSLKKAFFHFLLTVSH